MDLTNAKRADRNSDGVMFYKVWNGRKKPKMPAFNAEIDRGTGLGGRCLRRSL